jgi:2-polyprenyl-3-methyl-5-hydroxy-6-metoxy-1,4-benzoquinol methylase
VSATLALDIEKAQQTGMKLLGDLTGGIISVLMVVGDRLGLFVSLTPEQAFCLVDQDSPLYLTSIFGVLPDYWRNLDLLTGAFRLGGGVPQGRFGEEWLCGFQRFSRTAFVNYLCQDWIPAMPEIDARLRAEGSMADIGCGNGMALIQIARCYPQARLVGFDHHAPAIEAARKNAEAAGVGDRIRFEVRDAAEGIPGSYDLITCFDVVHDLPFPRQTLPGIREALAPGGSFFVLEFNFSDDLQENIDHPFGLGAFGYGASINYCMTTALAVGGEGTGTCMGERRLRAFAAEAGFSEVRRLDFPQNPFNLIFEIKA